MVPSWQTRDQYSIIDQARGNPASYYELLNRRDQEQRAITQQINRLQRQQQQATHKLKAVRKELNSTLQDNLELERQLNLIL